MLYERHHKVPSNMAVNQRESRRRQQKKKFNSSAAVSRVYARQCLDY